MVYRLWRRWCHGDFTTSQWEQLSYRLEKLRQFEDCRRFGLSVKASLMVSGEPRSTVYRWRRNYRREGLIGLLDESRARKTAPPRRVRTEAVVSRILALRRECPWGKRIICEWLRREGISIGVSSVGKALRELLSKGLISGSSAGKWRRSRRRFTDGWAKRQRGRPSVSGPGHLQMDHMKVSVSSGFQVMVFVARDVFSNAVCAMSGRAATAATACRFLRRAVKEFDFPIRQIQVDGGGEFRGCFEEQCRQEGIELRVIPPRSPRHNSKVENANGTVRREVFNFRNDVELSVAGVQCALDDFVRRYNEERPNLALSYRDGERRLRFHTPAEYIRAFNSDGNPAFGEIPI